MGRKKSSSSCRIFGTKARPRPDRIGLCAEPWFSIIIRTNVRTLMAPQLRARSSPRLKSDAAVNSARFEQQLGKILEHATEVFCQKGYAGASMRDIARATGMSLAGMYHYFGNKERLLYLIQKDTLTTILSRLRR